jgi:hypothetical protein
MNRAPVPKTTVRMPPDVVTWLQQKAAHNITSMTAEIVRVCRAQMAHERRQERAPSGIAD